MNRSLYSRGYRPMRARHAEALACRSQSVPPVPNLNMSDPSWTVLWRHIDRSLSAHGYSRKTRIYYRQVLRSFSKRVAGRPADVTSQTLRSYLHGLVQQRYSRAWVASNLSTLRGMFDKLGGLGIATNTLTPRRAWCLPHILSQLEVQRLLHAAPTVRDQLMLGLMYGCGLKVGEVCSLQWKHVDCAKRLLRVHFAGGTRVREVRLPKDLLPVLEEGVRRCEASDYIFRGATESRPLSTRAAGMILKRIVATAGIDKPITGMTLRHSYAVHSLEGGATIREVQETLGHEQVTTTMLYLRCLSAEVMASSHPVQNETARGITADELEHALHRGPPCEQKLFTEPLSTHAMDLPFPPATDTGATSFYRGLKTQMGRGFLAVRAMFKRRGPPS